MMFVSSPIGKKEIQLMQFSPMMKRRVRSLMHFLILQVLSNFDEYYFNSLYYKPAYAA